MFDGLLGWLGPRALTIARGQVVLLMAEFRTGASGPADGSTSRDWNLNGEIMR